MQYWLPYDIENVDYNAMVEVHIILEVEFESSWRLTMLLTVLAVLGKVFKYRLIDIMS